MKNAINWFEIPAKNFDRAVTFYSTVLKVELRKEDFMGVPHGIIPVGDGVGGAIVKREGVQPTTAGSLVYLNAEGDLDGTQSRIEPAGGKVILPKTSIGEQGYIVIFTDTEGNRVGLHSPN